MLDQCLKQGFRLNRFIGYSMLFFNGLMLQSMLLGGTPNPLRHWLPEVLMGLSFVSTVAYLIMNELGLKTFKRIHRIDPMILQKLSVLLPIAATGYLVISYLLLGQLGALLFLTVAVMMAQLLGHLRLARAIMAIGGVLFLAGFPLGYPRLMEVPLLHWRLDRGGLLLALQVIPFLMTLVHHHEVVSSMIFTTKDKVSKLQSLAATDGLTGLINRRQFNLQLQAELARARRHQKPLSLALFDIDDFKKINDFYGHPMGDRILRELGMLIRQNIRESDTAARYGGEEFALILPETRQTEAYELLERLRALIERTVFCLPDNPITATISVGVAQLDPHESTVFELVETADTALYEAKKQGKNRVVYGVVPTPKLQLHSPPPSFLLTPTDHSNRS